MPCWPGQITVGECIKVPWAMIAPHEAQARANHYQTLARLAERGGLSASEAIAILNDRPWQREPDAERMLKEAVAAWSA